MPAAQDDGNATGAEAGVETERESEKTGSSWASLPPLAHSQATLFLSDPLDIHTPAPAPQFWASGPAWARQRCRYPCQVTRSTDQHKEEYRTECASPHPQSPQLQSKHLPLIRSLSPAGKDRRICLPRPSPDHCHPGGGWEFWFGGQTGQCYGDVTRQSAQLHEPLQ